VSAVEREVRHLPPVIVTFSLPVSYPSTDPPCYSVSCHWLSDDQVSFTLSRSLSLSSHTSTFYRLYRTVLPTVVTAVISDILLMTYYVWGRFGWLAGWLPGWLVACLAGWLVGYN